MRWIAGILLLANLALAGYFLADIQGPAASSSDSVPLNVEKLSLRGQSRAAEVPARHTPESAALCVEWRGLSLDEFVQAREQLKTLTASRVMSFTEVPLNTRHWVIFPPLPSRQSAAQKLGELAAAGVQDVFVVKDAPWRNAISLGLYANAEAAGRRVREVEAKGVLGTRVELLPRQGTDYYFLIKSEDPDTLKSLSDIKQPYTASRLARIACPS
ncbi:MAG: hypothetical protein BGO61_14685 [Thiobacillus sp. 65-69]|nr:hypothetical protein [Thiobacillus sp.]ODU88796.1 MAG: hypothetical protein ABT21_10540 [Thiobacillus sp. SCN 65-179]OJW39123.1 MAG: hypothetical protein BGO61_14685 [Thiobacillus sp. 65-69]